MTVGSIALIAVLGSRSLAAAEAEAVKPARVEGKAEAATAIYIRTAPPGAKVAVDGKPAGSAPKLIPVPEGARRVTVTVELDGFERAERAIEVRGGRVTRVSFDLRPDGGEPAAPPAGAGAAPDLSTARGTAEAFLRALREGRADEADSYLGEEHRGKLGLLVNSFEPLDLSAVQVVTVLTAEGEACIVTGVIPPKRATAIAVSPEALGLTLIRIPPAPDARADRWRIREIWHIFDDADRNDLFRRFREKYPDAVEETPPATKAEMPAPAPGLSTARGTVEAFLRALREGRVGEADAYVEEGCRGRMWILAGVLDLSKARIETALTAEGEACVATGSMQRRLISPLQETGALGLALIRIPAVADARPDRWRIRDIDLLPDDAARDRFVGEFRKKHPDAAEEAPPPADARPAGPPAPAPDVSTARGTAEAFLRALREGRVGEADAHVEESRRGKVGMIPEALDLADARIASTLAAGGEACAVTAPLPPNRASKAAPAGGPTELGLALIRIPAAPDARADRWRIRDIDLLPDDAARDRFVEGFRKAHPEAAEEAPPSADAAAIRDVAERYGAALVRGYREALEDFWEYDEPLDREAGETLLAVFRAALPPEKSAKPARSPGVELALATPIDPDRFLACYYLPSSPVADGKPGPWLQVFRRVGGRWRTRPLPGLRGLADARSANAERVGRRAWARSVIALRGGIDDLDARIAGMRAEARAYSVLAGPPYDLEMFKGLAPALEAAIAPLEEMRGKPWKDILAAMLADPKGLSDPAAVPAEWSLLLYLSSAPGEKGISLPDATGGTMALEPVPCLGEDEIASAEVVESPAAGEGSAKRTTIHAKLTETGKRILARVSREAVDRRMAIVVEGKVIVAPFLRGPIEGGELAIDGQFSREEAEAIAAKLLAGQGKVRMFLSALREGKIER